MIIFVLGVNNRNLKMDKWLPAIGMELLAEIMLVAKLIMDLGIYR